MSYFGADRGQMQIDHYKRRDTCNYLYRVVGEDVYFGAGVAGKSKLCLVERSGNTVLIRASGHSGWCGRGTTTYYSPQLVVGEVTGEKVSVVYKITYTREFTKQAKARAKELFDALCRGEEPEAAGKWETSKE